MSHAPALFVSDGSPMFAVESGRLGPRLTALGAWLDDVRALLIVSPHWATDGLRVMSGKAPAKLHDFHGFPEALHRLRYPAPGAPGVADETIAALAAAGFHATADPARPRDRGAWVPAMHLRPEADRPVLQVSMPADLDAAGALRLGRALAPLRAHGVAVIGSGSLTHDLYEFRRDVRDPEYAQAFADWVRAAVQRGDQEALVDYRARAPQAARAHPTEEHFLPLLVALGAADRAPVTWIDGGITDGILSMDSFAWGAHAGGSVTGIDRRRAPRR